MNNNYVTTEQYDELVASIANVTYESGKQTGIAQGMAIVSLGINAILVAEKIYEIVKKKREDRNKEK